MAIVLKDGTAVDVKNENKTFWDLLKDYTIRVPELQRDYAYGRDVKDDKTDKKQISGDESTKIIRENLISGASNALKTGERLNLNFIYGSTPEKGKYLPIDGQQRLTTLFLIHWYIFQRAKDWNPLESLKNRFSYATRDTSARFCENICKNLDLDFKQEKLSTQIEDCSWFADTFKKDPSVRSMIVVLDSIHSEFINLKDSDITSYATKLKDATCSIGLESMTVSSIGNEEDLYIKMNGRGKQLSDFEIFKSLLQNSSELTKLLPKGAGAKGVTDFIGKFNTDFCQTFNGIINDPLEVENALYCFLRNYLMCEYFAQVSMDGIAEDNYRDDCGKFRFYNGKVLFTFFMDSDYLNYYKNDKKSKIIGNPDVNVDCLKKAIDVLDKINGYYTVNKKADFDTTYYAIDDRIKGLVSERTMTDDFIDFAIFEFLHKFGYPDASNPDKSDAFRMWKRFIFNISNNIDLKGSNESLIKVIRVIKDTISSISSYSENAVLQEIFNAKGNSLIAAVYQMKPQFDEESDKANLILTDKSWKNLLINAENYFRGGQIGFLLHMSKDSTGNCSKKDFQKYFDASKKVWNEEKCIQASEDDKLITRALLTLTDNTSTKTSHLIHSCTQTYEIPTKAYTEVLKNSDSKDPMEIKDRQEQWMILKSFLDEVSTGKTVKAAADDLIKGPTSLVDWKEFFVKNNVFNSEIGNATTFSNYIFKVNNDWLLLSARSVRSKNMSLKTLMLYYEMIDNGLKVDSKNLNPNPYQEIVDENGFPRRTIEYKNYNIGFDGTDYVIIEGVTKKSTIPDIITEIKKLP